MIKFIFKILFVLILICPAQAISAEQVLHKNLQKATITINAQKTGEKGKTYFYCTNMKKCSTEDVMREYYKNRGYKVMRAEHDFWNGVYYLTFQEEIYPSTLDEKLEAHYINPSDEFDKNIKIKCRYIQKTNLKTFINLQIEKHNGHYIRELDEWEFEGYKNPIEYFKSGIVQDFLARVDNKVFFIILDKIISDSKGRFRGTPDYIVWNDKKLIFVEVKRDKEKLSEKQIEWAEFLIKKKIPYNIVRVRGI